MTPEHNYIDDDFAEWDGEEDRRGKICDPASQAFGAANRILRDSKKYTVDKSGTVHIDTPDVFRLHDEKDVYKSSPSTLTPDSQTFIAAVTALVQWRVGLASLASKQVNKRDAQKVFICKKTNKLISEPIDADGSFMWNMEKYRLSPDGSTVQYMSVTGEWMPSDDVAYANRRQRVNMGTRGAAIRAFKKYFAARTVTREDYVDDGVSPFEIPDGFFREGDTAGFKKGTQARLDAMVHTAMKTIEGQVYFVEAKFASNPHVQKIRRILGDKFLKFSFCLQHLRSICERTIDAKLTPDFFEEIEKKIMELLVDLKNEMFDEKTASEVEKAYRDVFTLGQMNKGFPQEIWDQIKDLHGCQFTQKLHQLIETHISIQPFVREDILQIPYPDMRDTLGKFLGYNMPKGVFGTGRSEPLEEKDAPYCPDEDNDTGFGPCILLTSRVPLGRCDSPEEQTDAVSELNKIAEPKIPYAELGMAKMIDMATTDTAYGAPPFYHRGLRFRLRSTGDTDVHISYLYTGGFRAREFSNVEGTCKKKKYEKPDYRNEAGIAFGKVVPLDTMR